MSRLSRRAAAIVAALALFAWLTGRVLSDRYGWSQWLLWIPTPAVLAVWLLTLPATIGRRRALIAWAAVTIVLAGWFLVVEHRLLRRPAPDPAGLRILQWNVNHLGGEDADRIARRLVELDPQVAILSHAGSVPGHPAVEAWLGPDDRVLPLGAFTVVARVPVDRVGWVISADEMRIAYVRLDAGRAAGKALVLYLVDLPSDPRLARAGIAARARRYLDGTAAPPPDLALGDFNMTRGSASLRRLFPDLRHAFDEAGTGYGATFPRAFPLYHIDHVLLAPGVAATGFDIVDPGVTRHRAQLVTLTSSPP